MFGFFTNAIGFGERPAIKQTVTAANLTATVTATVVWYDMSTTGTNYVDQFVQATSAATPINSGTAITKFINRANTATYTMTVSGNPQYVTNANNTLGAVKFTGSQYGTLGSMSTVFGGKSGMTAIAVVKPAAMSTSTSGGLWICGSDNGPEMVIKYETSVWKCTVAGYTGATTVPLNTTTWQVFSFVFDGIAPATAGRLRFRYNKADQVLTYSGTAGTATGGSTDNYYIGGMGSGPSNQMSGQIGEFFIWNRALKVSEVSAIETYLGTKWGI
jgi:hypothetical protein